MAAMVDAARGGDPRARDALIVSQLPKVRRAARRRRDVEEAESAAMLGLVRAVDAFIAGARPVADFEGYVGMSIRNAALSADRDDARHRERVMRKVSGRAQVRDGDQWSPVSRRDAPTTEAQAEEDLLRGQDETTRAVARLKAEGRSNKEVAAMLGLSEPKVSRVMCALERSLSEEA